MELQEIVDDMDIPAFRRDVSNENNLRWLDRNIGINNKNHEHLKWAQVQIRYRLHLIDHVVPTAY